MMNQKQQRREKIEGIKNSLKSIKVISKNSLQVQAKKEKNRLRRQSLQEADCFLLQKLLRRYSDQDEQQDKSNVNTFNDKYGLHELIGEGANARVYKCEYKQTKKLYAVKIITMDEQHILELKRNFLSIKQLRNQSIIKYHALYFDLRKGLAYLVMEYFPYPNLSEIKTLAEEALRFIFAKLLQALAFVHERNICHRDIKPENVLFDATNRRIKIIDFGISKKFYQRGARRDMLTIIGTSLYLAPEILLGGGYDERVDLWSFGATLFSMIAGVTPFESQYHSETINKIIKGSYIFDEQRWGQYSYFAKDLVSRLLKPRELRLSIKEAMRHLWFGSYAKSPSQKTRRGSQDEKFKSLPRHDTFCIKIHEAFHSQQLSNIKNAYSKQQGESNTQSSPQQKKFLISRKLNLIENKQFDLEDSQQEQRSPSTVTSHGEPKQ